MRSGSTWSTSTPRSAAARNRELQAEIVGALDIDVEMSGGIRDDESLEAALATGCRRVNIGTAALEQPEWCARIIAEHGDRVAIGLDVRGRTLAARGWTREGGDLYEVLARLDAEGCARYVVTDVNKDGMLQGPNLQLLRDVCAATDRAGRRLGRRHHARRHRGADGPGRTTGVEGAIAGTALYEGRFTLEDALALTQPGARREPRRTRHPVPRRRRRPGGQGHQLPRPARRGRPRRAGPHLRRRGRRRADLPRHLRLPRGPRDHDGDRLARPPSRSSSRSPSAGESPRVDDVDRLLRAGADKVAVNTAAIRRPELVAEIADRFGNQVLVLSVDARRRPGHRLGVRGHHPRRPAVRRPRRDRVGGEGGRAGRRRDPAQRDGRRRHPGRLRPRPASGASAPRCRSP